MVRDRRKPAEFTITELKKEGSEVTTRGMKQSVLAPLPLPPPRGC